jgi:hypothetical protein
MRVPENRLLRLVDKHVEFGFVRERLKVSDSESGRPSIDPELLLRNAAGTMFALSFWKIQRGHLWNANCWSPAKKLCMLLARVRD